MVIQYYAYTLRDGVIHQIKVTRLNGVEQPLEWTGKTYRTQREANGDMIELNCK